MNYRLLVILSVITLDAVGIGLIFPILPRLLAELTGSSEVSVLYGVVIALYSLMQFVFSPVLGAMSDRYGRRPVLLASIGGATVDYLVMAFSPLFAVLLVGRAIAGVTSANMAVATAYISDITDETDRARRFGYMSACFGIGFIVGPLIGGVLGDVWLRGPFVVAAALNAANLALVFFVLPESRDRTRAAPKPLSLSSFNPVGPMRWAFGIRPLVPLIGMVFVVGLVGNIPGTVWVLYGMDKFHWNGQTVGFSLATFGLCHAGSQVFLVGPFTKRFGELKTIVIGTLFDCTAFVLVGLATHGWVAFAVAPLFAVAGVGPPAVQSLATKDVGEDKQGELQGVLSSVTSLTAIVGPLLGTFLYASTKHSWIGAVWICGAALYLTMVPLVLLRRRRGGVLT
jgi:DHA1 family tetracycline resistance protein-like MFS transporter